MPSKSSTWDGENGNPLIGESFGVLGSLFSLFGDGVNIGDRVLPWSDSEGVLGTVESDATSWGSVLTFSVLRVKLVLWTLPLPLDDTDIDESYQRMNNEHLIYESTESCGTQVPTILIDFKY